MSRVTNDSSFLVQFSLGDNQEPKIAKLPGSYFLLMATKEASYGWFGSGASTR